MSDEGRKSGRRPWEADVDVPPERFPSPGRPPRRPVPAPPSQDRQPQAIYPTEATMPVGSPVGGHRPGWRPGSPLPVPGGPSQRSAPPGPGPGYPRRQHEPELLTHVDRIDPTPPSPVDAVGNHGGSSEGGGGNNRGGSNRGGSNHGGSNQRQRGWRRFRHVVLVACLLGVLVPIAAFLVGWVVYDVPPPAALSAERKQVTTLYYSDGQTEIGRYVPEEGNRTEVPLDRVPLHVQDAVLAAEDRSFRSNPGFDIIGIGRAAWKQLTGGSGGGSTITQQYVKVATGDDAVSYLRKYREVIVAAKMTKENSKDQILEDYLNTIYFGRGAYGVQAASQAYFGKDVQDLSVSEGAMLAGVIQSPSRSDPAKNLDQAQARWNFVLDGMMAEGWLPAAERATLQFPITLPPDKAVPGSPGDDRAHIIDKALAELEAQGFSRDQLAVNGGRVVTTVDAGAQEAARDAVLTELDGQPENLHSSLVAINPRSGGVVAYYGGQDGVGFDLAGGPAWNPGSSFKPFAMLAALEQGIGANAVFNGTSPLEVGGVEYSNSESASFNALTLREAMTQSVNTAFVQLTDEVGADAVRDAAISAGIPAEIEGRKSLVEADNQQPGLGITLGQYPVHTIDMASAYATFANDGMRNEPFFVREYVDSDGAELYEHRPHPQPAFDESDLQRNTQLARNVTATLTGVADASGTPLDGGREVAAKTGTHQLGDTGSNAAAWMIGYTPSISTAVWVGDPANTAIVNAGGEDVFGRGLPGQIWQRFMDDYLEDREEETFPPVELLGGAAGPAADEMVSQNADNGGPETTETPLPPGEPAPGSDAELTETDDLIGDCFPFDCGDLEPEPTDAVEPQPGRPPRDGDELPAPPEPGASPKD